MSTMMAVKAPSSLPYPRTTSYRSNPRPNSKRSAIPTARIQTRIHRLIEDQGIVLMPGCYDPLSAAIVQKTGFSAGFISGPPEMAETARSVCSAASLIPIIADADTGGGNALNVQRTIKDLIAAGDAGCFLEDQAWLKKCGICVENRSYLQTNMLPK